MTITAPIVETVLKRFGDKTVIAFSGGNCSLVVLHIAIQTDPNVKVVFCDTTNEYPETYAFIEHVRTKWDLNLITVKPKKTWADCIKEYGPPKETRRHAPPRCCYYLKEEPARRIYRENQIECVLDGIRMEESWQRYCFGKHFGPLHYAKSWKLWKCHPILHWISQDVWAYLELNNVPHNPMYDRGIERIGCRGCTGHIGWEKEVIKHSGLDFYRWLQAKRGQTLLEVK
jgi:phosphoadenosine phosphosulfate reductase